MLRQLLPIVAAVLTVSPQAALALSKHPITVIISFDGMRYDYIDKTYTPNLHGFEHHGVTVPYMKNQFLTNTFPNHHSIATGLYIESHGVVANYFYDTKLKKELSGYKNEPGFWNYSDKIIPLYIANELAGDGRHSGVIMWPGSTEAWGPQKTKASHIKPFAKRSEFGFHKRVDMILDWINDPKKPANLIMAYFDEPDSIGHAYGPDSSQMISTIKEMDGIAGYFIEKVKKAGLLGKINIMFVSDHGMQEVSPTRKQIPHTSFFSGIDKSKYDIYGASPVLQILPRDSKDTEKIYNQIRSFEGKYNFKTYLRDNLRREKPEWHYSNSQRVMPILLVAEAGYVFEDYSKKNPGSLVRATGIHGYDNTNNKNMYPYFIAAGPIFKQGGDKMEPFENIDIYPFMCKAYGFAGHRANGTYENMLPLLTDKARKELFGAADEDSDSDDQLQLSSMACIAAASFLVGAALLATLRQLFCNSKSSKPAPGE